MNDFWDILLFAIFWFLIIFLMSLFPVGCYYNAKQEEERLQERFDEHEWKRIYRKANRS